ncbi:MAG: hypothetical protein WAL30_03900 [Candidatus Aquirickettsiella sp.]
MRKKLKNRWFAEKGKRLSLSYTYSKKTIKEADYIEIVEIAVENFNRLGIAILKYEPIEMGVIASDCSLDINFLKEKYKNQFIFELNAPDTPCANSIPLLYMVGIKDFQLITNKTDFISLPPFSSISCHTENRFHQRFGIGVILHEINHLIGIKQHAHAVAETNGILSNNIAIPNIDDILTNSTLLWAEKLKEVQKINSIYGSGDSIWKGGYTLISPFSMQHYSIKILMPFRSFNKTRISEILDEYKFTRELKDDYFYLLDNYAGIPTMYTYQDITALATAIYAFAPDSLVKLDLPYYHLVEGIYRSVADEKKLINIIERLRKAEKFNYPIFSQDNSVLRIDENCYFEESLRDRLKIVSLKRELIQCDFLEAPRVSFPLQLSADCILTGQSKESGDFYFNVTIKNSRQLIQRQLTLSVTEKVVKNKVLLGNPQPSYLLQESNASVNFIHLCQAVAYPKERSLNCSPAEITYPLDIENCFGEIKKPTEDYNFTVIFSNGEASKSCHIQLITSRVLLDIGNVPLNVSADKLVDISVVPAALTLLREDEKSLQKFAHLLSIPIFHGIFEGIVEGVNMRRSYKTLLNLIPRISLVMFGYTTYLSFGIASLGAFIPSFMGKYLKNKSVAMGKCIKLLFFILIMELEYAPSKLWELTGKLEFFPEVIELLNQLFAQMLIAPAIKTAGYFAGISLMKNFVGSTAKEVVVDRLLSQVPDHCVAKETNIFSFFTRVVPSNKQRAPALEVSSVACSL